MLKLGKESSNGEKGRKAGRDICQRKKSGMRGEKEKRGKRKREEIMKVNMQSEEQQQE